jgi:hypothetical protein
MARGISEYKEIERGLQRGKQTSQPLQAMPCNGVISIHGTCDDSAPKPGVIPLSCPFPPGYTGVRATLIASMRVFRLTSIKAH